MAAPNRWQRALAASTLDSLLCPGNLDSCEGRKAFGRSTESDLRPDPGNPLALWIPFWTVGNVVFVLFLSSFPPHFQLLQFPKQSNRQELGLAPGNFPGISLFKLFWMGSAGMPGIGLYSAECR